MAIEFNDKYTFEKLDFNGTTALIKNGERSACIRNQDMIEPTNIDTGNGMNGKLIKAPCIKECMAFKECVVTKKETGETKSGYTLMCIDIPNFIIITEAPKVSKLRLVE